jgi:uncharacterized linocin/CFP29 family protein
MFVYHDYVLNGQGFGEVGSRMQGVRFDPGMLRPYFDDKGRRCVTVQTGTVFNNVKGEYEPKFQKAYIDELRARGIDSPMFNATTLQKDAWVEVDRAVVRANRQRLRAWTDLASRNRRGGFNAMSRMTLEYQTMTDVGEAVVDMDAMTDARTDRPLYGIRSIPLPITHADFWFSEREIAVSRNTSTPLDTTMAEMAGRRVAESVEKVLIGIETGVTYGTRSTGPSPHEGTSTIYGYTNFPYRVTKTDLTIPTGSNPEAVMTDVLEMVETMQTNGFYGPYILYQSTGYTRYLSDDYFRAGSTSAVRSLRERLMQIEGIADIRRLDYLTSGYQMILVQMDPEVAQAIDGMGITTVQWDSQGGLRHNFKVMCIQVPLLRAPNNGVAGIIHATTG